MKKFTPSKLKTRKLTNYVSQRIIDFVDILAKEKQDEELKLIHEENEQLRVRLDHWEEYFIEMSDKMNNEIETFTKVFDSLLFIIF